MLFSNAGLCLELDTHHVLVAAWSCVQVPTEFLTWIKSKLLLSPKEGAFTPLYAATGNRDSWGRMKW
jgi:hypothetical protein